MSIATVRDHYSTIAILLSHLVYHCTLPLSPFANLPTCEIPEILWPETDLRSTPSMQAHSPLCISVYSRWKDAIAIRKWSLSSIGSPNMFIFELSHGKNLSLTTLSCLRCISLKFDAQYFTCWKVWTKVSWLEVLPHWLVILTLAVNLFSRIFTGEGTLGLGYLGCDSTEHRGQRL
jgi:hypothetical protein